MAVDNDLGDGSPEEGGVHSVSLTLAGDGLSLEDYPLFQRQVARKRVSIWQPTGSASTDSAVPQLGNHLSDKASAFLREASQDDAHLAVAPEWGFDLNDFWEHETLFFEEGAPLCILGCRPVALDDWPDILEDLESELRVLSAEIGDTEGRSYLTPTVVPLRLRDAETGDPERGLLVQFKTHSMGPSANPEEAQHLAPGETTWAIDPRHGSFELLPLTCSDILHSDHGDQAAGIARGGPSLVVHVQCNPEPFHEDWIGFRRSVFRGTGFSQTYLTANWASIEVDGETKEMGFSGLYAKRRESSPPSRFSSAYRCGGLMGAAHDGFVEHLWVFGDNVVASLAFTAEDPQVVHTPAQEFADLELVELREWREDGFAERQAAVPECGTTACQEWKEELPGDPLVRELITACCLTEVEPTSTLRLCHLNAVALDPLEQHDPALAIHAQRATEDPSTTCHRLLRAFEEANNAEDLRPNDECQPGELPFNAKKGVDGPGVCFVVVQDEVGSERSRAEAWQAAWSKERQESFLTFIAQRVDAGYEVSPGWRSEDAADVKKPPEDVGL